MPEELHVHKFQRTILGAKKKGYVVFKCMIPDCPTFLRPELVEGRTCLCWRCGVVMVLTKWHLSFRRPHCKKCTVTTDGRGKPASQPSEPVQWAVPPEINKEAL